MIDRCYVIMLFCYTAHVGFFFFKASELRRQTMISDWQMRERDLENERDRKIAIKIPI